MTAAAPDQTTPLKRCFQIDEAAAYLGMGRSKLYELIKAGDIEMGRLAGRSVIKREVLDDYVDRAYRPVSPARGMGSRAA